MRAIRRTLSTRARVGKVAARLTAALAMSLALLLARGASAGPRSGAQWYVETTGAACDDQRTTFEREITLACNAVGGTCHVASSAKDAELRAVLDCSGADASWTLVTRTIDGTVLATIDLAGPRDDRLREAAVEVARDAAPERSLAIETLRYAIPNEAPVSTQKRSEHVTLVAGGRASSMNGVAAPALYGAHVLGGVAIASSARLTLGLSGEGGGSGASAARHVRGGGGFAFGAPFDASSPFGFAAEIGLASTSAYARWATGGGPPPVETTTAGYAQGTLTLQLPRGAIRPYCSLSAAALTSGPNMVGSGEAGLAFALF